MKHKHEEDHNGNCYECGKDMLNNNYIDEVLKDYDRVFKDPMIEKYGDGFKLYCSNCDREKNKNFIKQSLQALEAQHNDYCDQLVLQNNMVLDKQEEEHQKELRELRDEIKNKKFKRGERLWCKECANRIAKIFNKYIKD